MAFDPRATFKITKLDAARRQLRTAIKLWFADDDPVSIHALACNAHQIVHDLNRKKKGPPLLLDTDFIKDEYRKDFVRLAKGPANFIKHADFRKQQSPSIEFKPETSQGFILFAIRGLGFLGEPLTHIEALYMAWTVLHKPNYLTAKGRKILLDPYPIDVLEQMRKVNKQEFFKAFLEVRKKPGKAVD